MVGKKKGKLSARRVVGLGAVLLLASSCATEPGRFTGLGGAAGGALGAGLGALIGSQTGDPATGLVMGGAAGSVAGAAAGNVFEAEEAELAGKRTVAQERDREISRRRDEIAALRSRSAASDRAGYYDDSPPVTRPARRDEQSGDSVSRPAPSPSILSLDAEDLRPVYVERRAGGRPQWESSAVQSPEQVQLEGAAEDEGSDPKAMPRRIAASPSQETRASARQETKIARGEGAGSREARRTTTASAPIDAGRSHSVKSVKIAPPIRPQTASAKRSKEAERAPLPATVALRQAPIKGGDRQREARSSEPPVKQVRRESRVVSEERYPATERVTRKVVSADSERKPSIPVKSASLKPALPVRPAPGLLAKEQVAQPRESRTQRAAIGRTENRASTTGAIQAGAGSSSRRVTNPQSLEVRAKSEPKGADKENMRKIASQAAASSLKRELVALAKEPAPSRERVVVARKESAPPLSMAPPVKDARNQVSAEDSGVKQASGECGQASQEIEKSNQVSEPAEKLFHYRRALRLCPSEARYHVHLGDHYRSLNRFADANFEYKEALALDPSNTTVKQKVEELKNG